jgi:uncharacterized RDD family membrane protein YckC
MRIMDETIKLARTLILVIVLSAFAAGIFTLWYWSNPDMLYLMLEGGYPMMFSTFFTVWALASCLVGILWFCATKRPASIAKELSR